MKETIPQLPLSIINSVIAVCKLSDLFLEKNVSTTSMFGIMDLIRCWFGATPCFHGAEGITGQYKFGGMSGWSVALLGVAKLVLGLGSSLVKILDQFPVGVLGVLLLFAGIELAICSMDMNSKEESFDGAYHWKQGNGMNLESRIEAWERLMKFIREAALYVMNTQSIEEAMRIFTKGLEPVDRCVGDECNELMNSGEELEVSANELIIPGFRDIVSAPF
ncbi:molybdate transporter 1-like [Forsythia ovata]|uniref:Molybdate transporter 1-like n=1 Tax=Forsythia ovata TaxID=205694 RepID=A0ABD1WTX7_9LAMI